MFGNAFREHRPKHRGTAGAVAGAGGTAHGKLARGNAHAFTQATSGKVGSPFNSAAYAHAMQPTTTLACGRQSRSGSARRGRPTAQSTSTQAHAMHGAHRPTNAPPVASSSANVVHACSSRPSTTAYGCTYIKSMASGGPSSQHSDPNPGILCTTTRSPSTTGRQGGNALRGARSAGAAAAGTTAVTTRAQ